MATTSFIRNELILGERLWRDRNSRRAKQELFEIRDRMEQVLYEYDMSEEAYSRLERGAPGTQDSDREAKARQAEIMQHLLEYKEACSQRSDVLNALNFFFSSYCEPTAAAKDSEEYCAGESTNLTPCDIDIVFNNIYDIDFGTDFDDAYISARSALERLKFLNSQIVSLATQILNKKACEFLETDEFTGKACCRATLDAAQTEYERLLVEMEAKVALNSRLKKYVLNQEEAVEVCQSIARRLAVDNAHMLASLTSSLKDVRSLSNELEKCGTMMREVKEKYKLPPNECVVNTDHEIISTRNVRSYRDLKTYEHNVREIEQDFSRLEQLSKLLDTMKVQLHKAGRRKELTEEQFRGRIAKLRSDCTEEGKVGSLKTRHRDENGEAKKGKKRKKKKAKKSTKSSTFSSTTTIGDCTESVVSEGDSAVLSPVSNISESVEHCSLRKEFVSIGKEKMKASLTSNVSSDSVFASRSESRTREPEPFKHDVVTALQSHSSPTDLQSHSSPTISTNDPLFSKVLRSSDTCIAHPT